MGWQKNENPMGHREIRRMELLCRNTEIPKIPKMQCNKTRNKHTLCCVLYLL